MKDEIIIKVLCEKMSLRDAMIAYYAGIALGQLVGRHLDTDACARYAVHYATELVHQLGIEK